MRQWYYLENDEERGAISEAELLQLFQSGVLHPDTLVWTEPLKDWIPASHITGLITPTPTLPLEQQVSLDSLPEYAPSGDQIRPWVRYWARVIDIVIFSVCAGILISITFPPILELPEIAFTLLLLFLYVFVEPIMLSSWGYTPGKALFRIRLRRSDGSKLPYDIALARSTKVWLRGMGLGAPIVSLFTLISAYRRLKEQGSTSWDEEGRFQISHQTIGDGRVLVAILIFGLYVALVVIGSVDA